MLLNIKGYFEECLDNSRLKKGELLELAYVTPVWRNLL